MLRDNCFLVCLPSGWFRLVKSSGPSPSHTDDKKGKAQYATPEQSQRAWRFLRSSIARSRAEDIAPVFDWYKAFTGAALYRPRQSVNRDATQRLLREFEWRLNTGELRFKSVEPPRQYTSFQRPVRFVGERPEPKPLWSTVENLAPSRPPAMSNEFSQVPASTPSEINLDAVVARIVDPPRAPTTARINAASIRAQPVNAAMSAVRLPEREQEASVMFTVEVVDQLGDPIPGIDLLLKHDGKVETLTTSGAGLVEFSSTGSRSAMVEFADCAKLAEHLQTHWSSPCELAPEEWLQANAELAVIEWRKDSRPGTFSLAHAEKKTLSLQPVPDFVEFKVVDENDNPVIDRPYRVILPDGSQIEGTLTETPVRINGVSEGECEFMVLLPERRASA